MIKRYLVSGFILIVVIAILGWWMNRMPNSKINQAAPELIQSSAEQIPFSIEALRQKQFPGSPLQIEQTLSGGANYASYIASYKSDGYKIYGLLTIPQGAAPASGWPVIIFNHGYIPPEQYTTTGRYGAYQDAFARAGFVTFKSDYRGHGQSEGQPEGAYYTPAYTSDVLNAYNSLRNQPLIDAWGKKIAIDRNHMGMWGHSMGGFITLQALEVDPSIQAAVIWAGVVGSYDSMANRWHRLLPFSPSQREHVARRNDLRQALYEKYGSPSASNQFWNDLSPVNHVGVITAKIQLDHGEADEEVPLEFSQELVNALKKAGKPVEFYTYPGADHNISGPSFNLAMQRSVEFFQRNLSSKP